MEKIVSIEGMKCEGCVTIIKEKFSAITGVTSVEIDLASKKAVVKSQEEIVMHDLIEALADTKFKVGLNY